MSLRSRQGLENNALLFDYVDIILRRLYICATHFFNDETAGQLSFFPDHLENNRAGHKVFFDAMHGPLAGARHGVEVRILVVGIEVRSSLISRRV